jgi:hypothetical protein
MRLLRYFIVNGLSLVSDASHVLLTQLPTKIRVLVIGVFGTIQVKDVVVGDNGPAICTQLLLYQ